jgi:hypothetical protein
MVRCNKLARAFLVLLLINLSACGFWKTEGPPSVNEKQIVILVCADYLKIVVSNKHHERLNSLMALTTYMENQPGLNKSTFLKQIESLQNRWPMDEHPLLNLDLKEIIVEDDLAKVTLRRKDGLESDPDVEIELFWSGTAWQIIDDSLFGPGNYIESITRASAVPPSL